MSSLNKVIIIGRLGVDPEIRVTQQGQSIANLKIATSEKYKDKAGNQVEKTEWHSVVIFNDNLANICQQHLKKGSQIYIEGQLQTRKWQDKDGQDRYTTEIVLKGYNSSLVMLGSSGDRNDNQQQKTKNNIPSNNNLSIDDDDIPF